MRIAYEIPITATSTIGSTQAYTSASICTGSLIDRYSDTNGFYYLRPLEIVYNRMYDNLGYTLNAKYLATIAWSNDVDYLFLNHPGAVAQGTNMSMIMGKYQKSTNTFTNLGRILINPLFITGTPTRTANSINAYLYRYSSGSVTVNGTTVTGSSTNWATNRIFQGSRIGFGTTNPTAVTQWYDIADVPTESNLTLTSPVPVNLSPGTSYVIEELKLYIPMQHATQAYNGVVVVGGLSETTFTNVGTVVNAYTGSAQDRQRGFYRIADFVTGSLIQVPQVIELEPPTSPTSQNGYLLASNSGNTQIQYSRFNVLFPVSQSNMAWSSSISESFGVSTGFFSGGTPQTTLKLATTKHGPGSGSLNLYTVNPGAFGSVGGRIYRTPVSAITSGSTSFIIDSCLEVPPGSVETSQFTGFSFVDYSPTTDRFYVQGLTTAPFNVMNVTQYNVIGDPLERQVLNGVYSLNKVSSDPNRPAMFNINGTRPNYAVNNDMMYVVTGTGTSGTYILYNIPIGADYKTATTTKQWVSFPVINTNNALAYYNVQPKSMDYLGSDNLGFRAERVKLYYRTSGIGDDSGAWTEVPENGDLSTVAVASEIQFALAWDVLGLLALPARIYGLLFSYEDGSQDVHYQPSIAESDIANNIFAWRQVQLWSSNIPELRIRLYNDDTNNLLLDDDTTAEALGTFEYSSDNGSTWNAWDDTQDVIGNYIRYTATSLPANTRIRALLTLS